MLKKINFEKKRKKNSWMDYYTVVSIYFTKYILYTLTSFSNLIKKNKTDYSSFC